MPKLPIYIVTRGNNMHGRPSQRPKAASFKKRAGLSRGTENREEVGEKGPASERSESEEGVRAPGSQYQISEKGPKQRERRDGDGEDGGKVASAPAREDIMHTQGRRRDGDGERASELR